MTFRKRQNSYIRTISVTAIFLLLILQGMMLGRVFESLEKTIHGTTDDCFRSACDIELITRIDKIHPKEGTILASPKGADVTFSSDTYLGFNDFCNEYGHPRNLDTLRFYFDKQLADKGIHNLEYKFVSVKTDTSFYNKPSAFYSDTRFDKVTFSGFKTHIVPVLSNLTQGIQAVIVNPYKVVMSRMILLLVASLLIMVFIIYSLVKQIAIIKKERALAAFRKDHTYSMIHDMNTPLTIANLNCGELEELEKSDKLTEKSEALEIISSLKESCSRLLSMRKKILDIYKLENKKIQFHREEIMLKDFYVSLIKRERSAAAKKISFENNCSDSISVAADRQYLTNVFDNLIENSIKYSGDEVLIQLCAERIKNRIVLTIRDNGMGMPQEKISLMMEKFERGTDTKEVEGYGLGLNFAYQITEMMGGEMTIESTANRGTAVILSFPLNNRHLK